MKNKWWIIIAVIVVAVIILSVSLIIFNNSGEKTPDFTVYDSEMNEVSLSDFFGKPIIVNFWATWCGPCCSELPSFDALCEKYKGEVVFLMVNLTDGTADTVDSVKKFIGENGYKFPVYYDITYSASDVYGVSSIPETLFINADGSLFNTHVGAMSEETLELYILALLENSK